MAEVISQLNIAQELFLVLFSILYGIMLQSIGGLQPFPLAKTLRGYIQQNGETKIYFGSCGGIKTDKWLKCMWRKRIAWSIFILNILPIAYLWSILGLGLLDKITFCHGFVPFWENLFLSIFQLFEIGVIFWSALGVFGFYRIYHAIAAKWWTTLFCDVELDKKRPLSFDAKAHLLWGLLFYLLPPIHFLLLINFPTLLGTLGIYPTSFLVWLIYVIDC